MAKKFIYSRHEGETKYYRFHCPGCECSHVIPVTGPKAWVWNGSEESPTLSPSILTSTPGIHDVCHSFVKDGKIQFLGDCCHGMKNQTVELPDVD